MAKRMPTAKKTEHTLPEELAEVVQDATPVEAPTASVTPDQIVDIIVRGSDDTKNAIRKALDLDKRTLVSANHRSLTAKCEIMFALLVK